MHKSYNIKKVSQQLFCWTYSQRIAQWIGERGLSEHLCLWAGCPEKALIGLRVCARHLANGSLEIKAAG
jgi:hypothetical protein